MMPVGNKDLEEGGRKKGRQINGFMIKRFGLFAGRITRFQPPPPAGQRKGRGPTPVFRAEPMNRPQLQTEK
jgi:hypothetical protein